MLDPTHPISAFFSHDPNEVLASLPSIARSSGAVTEAVALERRVGETGLVGARNGLFANRIFGEPGSFGHVRTAGVMHPSVFDSLPGLLGRDTPALVDVAEGRAALRGSELVPGSLDFEEDDLMGPRGLAEAVRRVAPDHPLLPLCCIIDVPVPPSAARPTVRVDLPEAIEDWIGPVNEAWLRFVERSQRELRLRELDVPWIILWSEAGEVQRVFSRVIALTRRAESHIVPALARPALSTEEVIAVAYAGVGRLVVQLADRVVVVDETGRELARLAPSGCHLRGAVEGRYAVFHGFSVETQPYFTSGEDDGAEPLWPAEFLERRLSSIIGEISVIDLDHEGGSYLSRAPASVPRNFVENHEPEELFLGQRELHVGGDRPTASAYTHDLRFALIEGESVEVIDVKSGLPVVHPAEPFPDEVTDALELASGALVEHDWDDQGGGFARAAGFASGRWWFLSSYGILHDHTGADALALVPPPAAAAFDPTCEHIAVAQGDEIVIVDRVRRAVKSRFRVSLGSKPR